MPLIATAKSRARNERRLRCRTKLAGALDNTKLPEPITIDVKAEYNDGPFGIRQGVRLIGSPTAQLSAPISGHDVVGLMNGDMRS